MVEYNTLTYQGNVRILLELFVDRLRRDGDVLAYADVKEATGLDIRAQHDPNAYQASLAARLECEKLDRDPFGVKPIRGQGLERIRIGIVGHAYPQSLLDQIRRRSKKAIDSTTRSLKYALDDSEALMIRAQTLIHSDILARTHRDKWQSVYANLSNGVQPDRPPVSMRAVLQRANDERRRK